MSSRSVIVIGGGLAGIAAAALLAHAGCRVTLLESRPRLGGRAGSIVDRETDTLIDNCQHVSMGCCVNFQKLCQLTGTADLFAVERELSFIARDGHINTLKNGWLPAPAHLLGSFAGLSYLTWSEKASLARALLRLVRATPPASGRFLDWLDGQRQTPQVRSRFWNIVLVSALSESLDRIDFEHARKVFVDGFLRHANGWQVHLLTVPLGEFYDDYLGTWLRGQGGTIRTQAGVAELLTEPGSGSTGENRGENRLAAIRLRTGEVLTADDYILATSFDVAARLLPESVQQAEHFAGLTQLETAPITSVHFWLDRELTPLRHAVLIDRVSQWMFNRTAILKSTPNSPDRDESAAALNESSSMLQVVISNSRELKHQISADSVPASQQQLIDTVWQELREIWPSAESIQIRHARVITEHRAVFSVTPGVERLRPPQQTPLVNLQLAGDYTQTGWPATMEGAVRSGFLAAQNILRRDTVAAAALPETGTLAPDLPTSLGLKILQFPGL